MHAVVAIEWSQGIEDAWADIASFVPKFIGFLLVLAIGWFVAKAIARLADAALERVGFDSAVERGGIKAALERTKYDASDIVGRIIFYALLLFVLQLAFGIFGSNPISDQIEGVIAYLPKVLAAIFILVVLSAVAAGAKVLIGGALGGLSYGELLASVASGAIITVGVFMALNQLQIAPDIVNGLFYALLAIIAGSAIIAIGGSGIGPLRHQWERVIARVQEEGPRVRQQVQTSRSRSQSDATTATPAQPPTSEPGSTSMR